jgi:hypothetical protein
MFPAKENQKLPEESDTLASTNPPIILLFINVTGTPELKHIPAFDPKYQLLNSPWEKPLSGNKPRRVGAQAERIRKNLETGFVVVENDLTGGVGQYLNICVATSVKIQKLRNGCL